MGQYDTIILFLLFSFIPFLHYTLYYCHENTPLKVVKVRQEIVPCKIVDLSMSGVG